MNRNIRILAVLTSLLFVASLWAQPKMSSEGPQRRRVRRALSEQEMNMPGPGPVKAPPQRLVDDIETQISGLEAEKKALIGELQAIQTLMKEGKTKEALERIDTFIKEKQAFYEQQLTTLRRRADSLRRSSRMQEHRVQMANIAGTPMKPFHGKDFEGKKIDVSDYKDKVIVLEWMNPQCPFSNHFYKNKAMVNLAKKYQDKDVVWLAINSTHFANPEEMKAFIKEHYVPYPILDDRDGKIGHLYNARTTPHMFVINKEGVIVYNGAIDSAGDKDKTKPVVNYVDQALTELLDNKPVSIPYKEPYGCTVKYAP